MTGFEPVQGVQSRVAFLATLIVFVYVISLSAPPAGVLSVGGDMSDGAAGYDASISEAAAIDGGHYLQATSTFGKFLYRLGDKLGLYNGKKKVTLFDPNSGTYVTKKVWKYDKNDVVKEWNANHPYTECSSDTDCNDGNPVTTDICVASSGVYYCKHDACSIVTYYQDADNDGYGNVNVSISQCGVPAGYVSNPDDCNDGNPALNPNTVWYKDEDNDGYSDGTTKTQCTQPAGYKLAADLTTITGDCDDTRAELNLTTMWYRDADNDGYSDGISVMQCPQPAGYKLAANLTATSGDTDDNNPNINPGATELCNGIDDNSNSIVDDGIADNVTDVYGYGNVGECKVKIDSCISGSWQTIQWAVNASAEVCDGKDNDCDGSVDEGGVCSSTIYYCDGDTDGYISAVQSGSCSSYNCTPSGCSGTPGNDCNDAIAAIHPGATEICNGIDDNCNNQTDEGSIGTTSYHDFDNDTYGDAGDSTQVCPTPSGYVGNPDDCNDNDAAINPAAIEMCDAIDNDCDGQADEGLAGATVVGTPFQLVPAGHTFVGWPADIAYGNGKYLAVWHSNHTGTFNVYGRIVYDNESMGPVIDIAVNAGFDELDTNIAYNANANKWLVVYDDFRSGSREQYGRVLSGDGTPEGSAFLVQSPGSIYKTPVVPTTSGFFVVLGLANQIYGRTISVTGTVGSLVTITNVSYAGFPQATYAPALGKIFVVWQDGRTGNEAPFGTYGLSVYGRFLDANGNTTGNEFTVIPDDPSYPGAPSVAYNGKDNTFLVSWEDQRTGVYSKPDVWIQRIDASGAPNGTESQLNDQDLGSETDVDIAYNPVLNKYMAVWWVAGSGTQTKARIINSDGTFDGGQFDIPGVHMPFVAASGISDKFIVHGRNATMVRGMCSATPATFFGRVTDSETGLPLPGKKISFYSDTGIDGQYGNVTNLENYMYNTWKTLTPRTVPNATTDTDGYFFANLPDGTYNYVIQGSREDEMEFKLSGSGSRDSQIARTKIVMPRTAYVKVYFESASAGLKSDVYMNGTPPIMMIPNSTIGMSYVTSSTYANGTELKFFIRVNGTPWGLGIYDHWSDSQYARVEQLDSDTWRIYFEDLPANRADWDFNDVVVLVDIIDTQNPSIPPADCDGDGNPNYNDTNDSWCDIGDNSSAQTNFVADGHILYSGKYENNNNYTCGQRVRFVMFGTNNGSATEAVTFEVQDHTSIAGPNAPINAPIIYNGSISNASESLTVPGGSTAEKNFDWTIPCPRNIGKYDIHMIWKGSVWHDIGEFYVINDTIVPTINVGAGGSIFRGQNITIGYYAHDDPTNGTIPSQVVTMSEISGVPDTSINVTVNKGNGDANVSVFGGNQNVTLTYNTSGNFTVRFTACDPAGNCDYKERNVTVWITEDDADAIALPLYTQFGLAGANYKTDYYGWINASSPNLYAQWDRYNTAWRIGDEYLTVGNNLTSDGSGNWTDDATAATGLENTINLCSGPEYMKPIPPSTAAQYNQTLYNYLAKLNATGPKPPNCNAI